MSTFIIVWLGQAISLIGSNLTGFTLGIWIYQTTDSTTQFSLIYLCTELPAILVAPFSGAIVDRWDKRWLMILSDTGSGLSTIAIAILLGLGDLEIWHIYLAMAVSSTFQGFQLPAYYTTPTLLVPKKHFSRANGMIQVGKAAGKIFSPLLAGILLPKIKLHGVILVDFATFVFSLLTLLLVKFPQYRKNKRNQETKTLLWQDINSAWNYLLERPGLMMLLMFFAVTNFTIGLVQVLFTPMVLSFTNTEILGRILSFGSSGLLFGAILMSTWGGPKKRIYGIFGFELLLGLSILMAGLKPSSILIAISVFTFSFSIPIIICCANAIRQVKVALELQGRVFAMWGAIAWLPFPFAYLVAGSLVDRIFQPMLLEGGLLADSMGQIVGVGPGRGIGFLFVLIGIFILFATITAYQYLPMRLVEDELPDAVIR